MLTFEVTRQYEECSLTFFYLPIKNNIYFFTREYNDSIINTKKSDDFQAVSNSQNCHER